MACSVCDESLRKLSFTYWIIILALSRSNNVDFSAAWSNNFNILSIRALQEDCCSWLKLVLRNIKFFTLWFVELNGRNSSIGLDLSFLWVYNLNSGDHRIEDHTNILARFYSNPLEHKYYLLPIVMELTFPEMLTTEFSLLKMIIDCLLSETWIWIPEFPFW